MTKLLNELKQNNLYNKLLNTNIDEIENGPISRPQLNLDYNSNNLPFDILKELISNIDFGNVNSKNYIKNFLKAINKYMSYSCLYKYKLDYVLQMIHEEIVTITDEDINSKAYLDGLNYFIKTLKLVKQISIKNLNKNI